MSTAIRGRMSLLSGARSSLQFRRRNIKDSQADPALVASRRSLGTQKLRSRLHRENSTGNIRRQAWQNLYRSLNIHMIMLCGPII